MLLLVMMQRIASLLSGLAIATIFILLILLSAISNSKPQISSHSLLPTSSTGRNPRLRVFVADLPRAFNRGILDRFWSIHSPDSRIPASSDPDPHPASSLPSRYPENPLIKQYSAEYWLLGDLEAREGSSIVERVSSAEEADVIFVPFFATLSAEMELGWGRKGGFNKKEGNGDYKRQREVVDRVMASEAWLRSGGRDHVFVLTDPVAMWHVRAEIAPAILLVVDFGGWYKLDSKTSSSDNSTNFVHHTQVSLLKDVIVPYTHLLPTLKLSEDRQRNTLLYFKGAKHRHRGGLVREQLWDLLIDEPGVVLEEGFPNATGREQSIQGMRSSEFCLHPAGDTPTSCRLFDAIASLCIPVIVSDNIELPFEGILDYKNFALFVAAGEALKPKWLVSHLRGISLARKDEFRKNMAEVHSAFEFDNGYEDGIGPAPPGGAVDYIWRKVHQKVPMIREAIIRERRKPRDVSVPLRCHCT